MNKKKFSYKAFVHLFFVLYGFICIVPFLLIVSISLSNETDIINKGFSLIPEHFSGAAYSQIFQNPKSLINAYGVTILNAVAGTALAIIMQAMLGYVLSRDTCAFKKPINIMLVITMFFHGGLIPSYVINTQVFHLGDTIWIYILSGCMSAYTVFVFRTFFSTIPKSLIESAQLDGATEMQMLAKITVPLSKPVLATFTFTGMLSRWNDYSIPMYYITDDKLYNLQYLLQQILNEATFLKQLKDSMPQVADAVAIPSETLKFAMCILAAGPMVLVFPFFQKYFAKGMVVGAVKG